MRTPTFAPSLLVLAFSAVLVEPKALAWNCDSICAINQSNCLDWKKAHCPIGTSNPFTNRPSPTQQQPPTPLRDNQGCCVLGAPCPPPKRPCPPIGGAKPAGGSLNYELEESPSLAPESPREPAPEPALLPSPYRGGYRGIDEETEQRFMMEHTGLRASRVFSGPGQFPPNLFAAYGIVAFQALASDSKETERYRSICRGYLAAIPAAKTLREEGVPLKQQMVTAWPLTENILANSLNSASTAKYNSCDKIVASTNLLLSHDAIHKAKSITRKPALNGRGPYLIAWSPAATIGKSDAAVLVLDLSNVTTSDGAVAIFQDWADKIEKNPQLWKGGWDLNSLRLSLRLWADRWGAGVLAILSPTTK